MRKIKGGKREKWIPSSDHFSRAANWKDHSKLSETRPLLVLDEFRSFCSARDDRRTHHWSHVLFDRFDSKFDFWMFLAMEFRELTRRRENAIFFHVTFTSLISLAVEHLLKKRNTRRRYYRIGNSVRLSVFEFNSQWNRTINLRCTFRLAHISYNSRNSIAPQCNKENAIYS